MLQKVQNSVLAGPVYQVEDTRQRPRKPLDELSTFKKFGIRESNATDGESSDSLVKRIPLTKISTLVSQFQNRKNHYSNESVTRIITAVSNDTFTWAAFDPIIVWERTDRPGHYYVLSGHSRLEAFTRLSESNNEFVSIPAKIFVGTFDDAKKLALESNTLSTKETDTERATYYRNLRNSGMATNEVIKSAKENEASNWKRIINFSFLNATGKAIQFLQQLETGDETSKNNLVNICNWIGNIRLAYPQISNAHESELLDYLIDGGYGTKAGQFSNLEQFKAKVYDLIQKNTEFGNFKSDQPLNIQSAIYLTPIEREYNDKLIELQKAVKEATSIRDQKKKEFAARGANQDQFIDALKPYDSQVYFAQTALVDHVARKDYMLQASKNQTALFGVPKLEDYGQLVPGGRINMHWGLKHEIRTKNHGNRPMPNFDWCYSPELFVKHFNLRSVEFGNWLSQEERAQWLFDTALSLQNLAKCLGVNEGEIGMNKKLSIALGARGRGGRAMAHYERYSWAIINLTKTKGYETLAHEYGHAIDNLLGIRHGLKLVWPSGGDSTRTKVNWELAKKKTVLGFFEKLFAKLYHNPDETETVFKERVKKMEGEYWPSRVEIFARTFEHFIRLRLGDLNITDFFLASRGYEKDQHYPTDEIIKRCYPELKLIAKAALIKVNKLGAAAVLAQNSGLNFNGFEPKYNQDLNFDDYIGRANFRVKTTDGGLDDTIRIIKEVITNHKSETAKLAKVLFTGNHSQDCFNIWHFIKTRIKYDFDQGGEEIRTPANTWANRHFRSDCEDFSIFASTLLLNMGYEAEPHVVGFSPLAGMPGEWHHIFATSKGVIIDPVLDTFNKLPDQIIRTMKIQVLSGIPENAIIQGLGCACNVDPITRRLLTERGNHIEKYKATGNLNHAKELRKLQYLILLNGLQEREIVLHIMPWIDDISADGIFYFKEGAPLDEIAQLLETGGEALGKVNFKKVVKDAGQAIKQTVVSQGKNVANQSKNLAKATKNAAKDPKAAIKNAPKNLVKAIRVINPTNIAAREAFKALLRVNIFGMAMKLGYGYLTQAEAEKLKLNIAEWKKAVANTKAVEEKFIKLAGGDVDSFRNAIKDGRNKGVKGSKAFTSLGGEPVTTAASIAAATPLLLALLAMVNKNDPNAISNGQTKLRVINNGNGTYTVEGKILKVQGDNLVDETGLPVMTIKEADAEIAVQTAQTAKQAASAVSDLVKKFSSNSEGSNTFSNDQERADFNDATGGFDDKINDFTSSTWFKWVLGGLGITALVIGLKKFVFKSKSK